VTISPISIIAILVLGVLFFGKNLPEVAKQIGTALLEFRKGVNEWKETHHRPSGAARSSDSAAKAAAVQDEPGERFETLGTKFVPPSEGV